MKKLLIFSISAVLVIGLAAFKQGEPKKAKKAKKATTEAPAQAAAAPKVAASDKAYDVVFDRTFHDFGKVQEGEQVKTTFKMTNLGKEPVIIQRDQVQCGCTTPTYSKEPVMPGKSTEIVIGFNTNGKMGINNKTVTLFTNGGTHELSFKCEVIAKAPIDEPSNGTPVKIKTN